MKKKTNLLARVAVLIFAVICSAGAWASDVITVGGINHGSSYLPSYPNNTYAMSQQIYTKSEIGKTGQITSIAFYNYDTGSARNYNIYLSLTSKDSFSSATDWVTVSDGDLVFSGTVNLSQGVWTTIDLDTPFNYDGTKNLLLTVDDNTGKSTGSNHNVGVYNASGNQALYYSKLFGTPVNLDPKQTITQEGTLYDRKNGIQLCFETYPKPSRLEAVEIGDVSAKIQCMLRSGATAWNLRYKKASANNWTTINDLTTSSKTIEDLTAGTKYEAQAQAVFASNNLSEWTNSLIFATNCCPVEQQTELQYSLWGNYSNWYGFAVQIMDITNEEAPVEAAYICPPSYERYTGAVTLCCGHTYKVNWIYDANHSNVNRQFSFSLYLEPGDLIYSMEQGEAPEKNSELTTFVADCGFCASMPKDISIDEIFHDGATISFTSATANGNIAYSTEADFNPATSTNMVSVAFDAGGNGAADGGDGNGAVSYNLSGLQPLTDYYVAVQSVCTAQPLDESGKSRWTQPVKFTTGAEEAPVDDIITIGSGSTKATISWTSKGKETKHNIYIRKQTGAGTPVNSSQVKVFDLDEDGYTFEKTGKDEWGSFIYSSSFKNILTEVSNWFVVTDVPADAVVKVKAKEGKSKLPDDTNGKAKVTEVFSVGAERQTATGEDLNSEILTKITSQNNLRKSGKSLSRSLWMEKYYQYKNKKTEWTFAERGSAEEKALAKELNSLRRELGLDKKKVKNAARHSISAGYKAYKKSKKSKARRRASDGESEQYFVWINHEEGNGFLNISDLEIVSPENMGEWIAVEGVTGNSYTFDNLIPGATYQVIIEPVYDDDTTGPEEGMMFTTLSELADPLPGEFSIGSDKKVQFAKGNLRCKGDKYEAQWSIASHQYDILGQDNIEVQSSSSYPAWQVDLLCWSTAKNYYGIETFYYNDDDDAMQYFLGDFADWGENSTLITDLGTGWSTLSKEEWNYILNERPNATTLRTFATVNGVKGLVILPDEWNAPYGIILSDNMTAEQWAVIEQTGAVFLPAAGQMVVSYDSETRKTTTNITEAGSYWTSTPASDASGMKASVLSFTDTDGSLDTDLNRRVATAVRLVKVAEKEPETELGTAFTDGMTWATYVSEKSLATPEGLQAYVVSGATDTEVTATTIDYIPAGVGVLLERADATVTDYKAKAYKGTEANLTSMLVGSAITASTATPFVDYVLYNDEFVLSSTTTVAAGHAYLPFASVTAGARSMTIVTGGDATDIKTIDAEAVGNDAWYTIDGRLLNRKPSKKGLYIKNGNKVIIK